MLACAASLPSYPHRLPKTQHRMSVRSRFDSTVRYELSEPSELSELSEINEQRCLRLSSSSDSVGQFIPYSRSRDVSFLGKISTTPAVFFAHGTFNVP